jgi:hypothetical protein
LLLQRQFHDLGVDTTSPGFYDDPAFLAAERHNPQILTDYGEFVRLRPQSAAEIERARAVVPIVTEEVCAEIEREGALGMCNNAGQLLVRCLDRLGVWSYSVVGAMNATVRAPGGRETRFFWVMDDRDTPTSQLGHIWSAAPPFGLIDPTFRMQGWSPAIQAAAPRFALVEKTTPAKPIANDMVAPRYRAGYRADFNRDIPLKHFNGLNNDYESFLRAFPGFSAEIGSISARFFPTGVGASDLPLETLFDGGARRFWNDRIAPALEVERI